MAEVASHVWSGRHGGGMTVGRLLAAIGYPVRAPEGALSFTLLVDGVEIVASEEAGALRLTCRLTDDASQVPRLAAYAAGRLLRENAVLACDGRGAFLWREVDGGTEASALRHVFEDFADSCDWWRARLETQPDAEGAPAPSEMLIRP